MSFYCSGSCFALRLVLVAVLVVAGLFEAGAARAGEGADAVGYGAGRVVPAVRWAAPAGAHDGLTTILGATEPALPTAGDGPAQIGTFGDPFQEPTIGGQLTEINVTSPTGIVAIDRFNGSDTAGMIWDAIERKVRK